MVYLTRRLLQSLPVIIMASIPVFLILHFAPGDPALTLAGEDASKETIALIRASLDLDKPLWMQYSLWLEKIAMGDLGKSYMLDIPVIDLVMQRLKATLELSLAAIFLAVIIAVPLGIKAALSRGGWVDHVITAATSIAIAIPNFWLGIVLVIIFGVLLDLLPAGGRVAFFESPLEALRFLILPATTLALYVAATLSRFIRTSMIEVLVQDYIRTARSKGLSRNQIIYGHALKNAIIPALTVLGAQFGRLVSGAIIVESIFSWPGLGSLMLEAIRNRDYPIIQGGLLIFIFLVIVTNIITDLLYGLADPRIQLASGK